MMTTTRLVFVSRQAGRRLLARSNVGAAAALSCNDHLVPSANTASSPSSSLATPTHRRTLFTNRPPIVSSATLNNHNHHARSFSSAAPLADDSDSDDNNNIIPFKLADIGEGIKEVEILQWFVQTGDKVQQFDRICEVQSDKATVEITSRYDGVVTELAGGAVGDMVQVGDALLLIQVEGGAGGASDTSTTTDNKPEQSVLHSHDTADQQLHIPHVASQFHLDSDSNSNNQSQQQQSNDSTTTSTAKGKVLATPAVRKLGMEYNLDLSTLVGTGPQGRVLKSDVLTFLRESGRMAGASAAAGAAATAPDTAATAAATPGKATSPSQLEQDEVITMKGYHRLMIQTMIQSQEIPHMGYTDEFNLTKLMDCRKDLAALAGSDNTKISILAFFLKATSLSLLEYPIVNASWQDIDKGQVTLWKNHNIGLAMATPRGLVVPVVHHCQDKSLLEIQHDIDALKEIAAAGKLSEQHLTGATISISNIGSLGGGTYMNPLIVPPQAAIGAMGALQTLPRFDDEGEVAAAKVMNISWAGDHRLMDGATLAKFSNRCKEYLEDPVKMLVSMK